MLNYLTCYESDAPKIRVGSPEGDGGYIICDNIGVYDAIVSGGISSNTSFENNMIELTNAPCYAYDHTINKLPRDSHKDITWFKKAVGKINTENESNFDTHFDQYNDIFLKLDIEGCEFAFFQQLTDLNLLKIKQMVVEFHHPWKHVHLFEKISKSHYLLHLHVNNSSKLGTFNGVSVPGVFETTFVRKSELNLYNVRLNTFKIPSNLDRKNHSRFEEVKIDWPPFVWPQRR